MKNSSKAQKFKKLGIISHKELLDKTYGKRGTKKREAFENELQIEIIEALLIKYSKEK